MSKIDDQAQTSPQLLTALAGVHDRKRLMLELQKRQELKRIEDHDKREAELQKHRARWTTPGLEVPLRELPEGVFRPLERKGYGESKRQMKVRRVLTGSDHAEKKDGATIRRVTGKTNRDNRRNGRPRPDSTTKDGEKKVANN